MRYIARMSRTLPEFDLADRLRKAREWADLDQTELATRMGVSRGTISNNELGKTEPRLIVIRAWALATGVPIEWLMTGRAPVGDGPPSDGTAIGWKRAETRLSAIGTRLTAGCRDLAFGYPSLPDTA